MDVYIYDYIWMFIMNDDVLVICSFDFIEYCIKLIDTGCYCFYHVN